MIVVRRIDLKRLPQYSSPTPKTTAMAIAASVIWSCSKPRMRTWSGNARVGLRELEQRLAEPQPDAGVERDPGRRQEQDVRRAHQREVAPEPDVRRGDRLGLAGRVLDAAPVDEERDAVDDGVEVESVRPDRANSFGATMNPKPSPASVAPSNRAAALPRSSSLPAVARAMKPRIDGTLAAVEAPSSSRVRPRIGSGPTGSRC